MATEELTLVKPAEELHAAFLNLLADFEQAGDPYFDFVQAQIKSDFAGYVRQLEDYSFGRGLPAGRLPWTTLWLVRGGSELIGVVEIRHRLNQILEREGGHIRYAIRPAEREKGYSNALLNLAFDRLRALGWSRVLLTCSSDQLPSLRVIEKSGGRLSGQVFSDRTGGLISRYWVELGALA